MRKLLSCSLESKNQLMYSRIRIFEHGEFEQAPSCQDYLQRIATGLTEFEDSNGGSVAAASVAAAGSDWREQLQRGDRVKVRHLDSLLLPRSTLTFLSSPALSTVLRADAHLSLTPHRFASLS